MSRKRESKEKTVYRHLKNRFFERFHIELTKNDLMSIIKQIQNGQSRCLISQSRNRSIHIITINNNEYAVVYNKDKKIIHTVLPDSWRTTDYTNPEYLRSEHFITHSGEIQGI